MIWGPIYDSDSNSSESFHLDRLQLLGVSNDISSSSVRWRGEFRPRGAARQPRKLRWIERRIVRHRRVFNGREDFVFAGLVIANFASCAGLAILAQLIA